ncbi:hypothetical protein PHYSODRAFT_315347 [Phytophthora sojae]|uniref:Uncharacterized protein n=1 Tax=Phytophthora sojae (strain P6497) TaxID=1094619 RepID=G4ZIW6_PHYSP|nr:hypothetical protein PHYSODRAFT_315347 [Phytophthora sojae]EGZ18771.1 hypothetical protein PHYSODRAFT_315347 [Phytophthora sojae]|eukprot:XP_009527829.1 hypothetical protein PHYSODRAFT_315347 [Phytophthora sojae]
MREKRRREQQRQRMVNWRRLKKEKMADMLYERRVLEKELQLQVMEARVRLDRMQVGSLATAYRQSLVECAALTSENIALREAIEHQTSIKTQLERETDAFLGQLRPVDPPPSLSNDETGWCVQFPNNEPSLYFTPFTRAEFEAIVSRNDIAVSHPCTATIGKILGWTVHYSPLTQTTPGESFMARARFTRRLRCPLDEAERILPRLDKKLWPVLVEPRSWGLTQTGETFCQVLQDFSQNAHLMVCNLPGEVNLRYLVLAWHTRQRRSDGKRDDKYILTIGDSQANARNRDVEGPQKDVQWVLEGGICTTITEVDESTIDVVCEQWAGCLSEQHGRELYIDWIRFPVCLEQNVSPARLLCL